MIPAPVLVRFDVVINTRASHADWRRSDIPPPAEAEAKYWREFTDERAAEATGTQTKQPASGPG